MSNTQPTRRAILTGAGLTALDLTLAACGSKPSTSDGASASASSGAADGGKKVTVLTHDSFNVPKDLKAAFEKSSGYTLEVIPSGDTGELTNKLILTKDAPLGDAVFGIDNTFASRAISEKVIDDTVSVTLPTGADQYLVDGHKGLVPIDFGEVCVNVDLDWFEKNTLTLPATFEDLTKPEYKDLFVAINPSTSSTGLAFLVATVGHFGEDGFAQYWKDLKANGTKIVEGWTAAYETDFSAGEGKGAYPIVVSYASSPAATVSEDGTTSSTQALLATSTRQVEYAGVLAGAVNPQGAKAFIEWMLSQDVQTSIPDNMYMYPVNPEATLSEKITKFGKTSDVPVVVSAADIAAKRESWLATWTEAVGA
ncbi:thiamine ABC transporter substrate binding subunit [Actinomyces trachealis]|uniref:thiamine ABC transporter substrate-binding protein n=1 Tax=Actinomyces trachealis TaxID=2763540 RepID=UPI001892B297|nr:thiamine ABC transporter substrate-binding protein [Actinomyces trachealis]